jgi:hypothetical protein
MVLDCFHGPRDAERSDATLRIMLMALYWADRLYLREHPETPDLYDSGVVYQEEPEGAEDWQDIPTCLRLGFGDCIPLNTALLLESGERITLGELTPRDRIFDGENFVNVIQCCTTGVKPTLEARVSGGGMLYLSPEHRVFRSDGRETLVGDLQIGDKLLGESGSARTVETLRKFVPQICGDLTTESGRVFLPDVGVVVHNCEDLACWQAAELAERYGIDALPDYTKQVLGDGRVLYHIIVRLPDGVSLPDGTVTTSFGARGFTLDPSRQCGMV